MADAEKTKSSKASKAKDVDAAGKKAFPEAGAEHRAAETPDVEENPQVEREMDGKAVGKPEAKKKAADKPEAKKKAGDKPEAKDVYKRQHEDLRGCGGIQDRDG